MSFEQFLVYSARHGEIADVQEMIEVTGPPIDLNFKDEKMSQNTALHMASANGHVEIVRILLKQGDRTKIDELNDSGNTALHYASLNGMKEVVELLLEYKANAKIKNGIGRAPIEDALQAGHGDIGEMLAPVSELDDDKMYTTFDGSKPPIEDEQDIPDGMFPEDAQDKRSHKSEE